MTRLAWLGTRTERYDETTAFFRDVLGLTQRYEKPGFAMFQLPGAERDFVEVFGPDVPDSSFYTTGPVVGLLVDDIEQARAELATAGVELIVRFTGRRAWRGTGGFTFADPTGTSTRWCRVRESGPSDPVSLRRRRRG